MKTTPEPTGPRRPRWLAPVVAIGAAAAITAGAFALTSATHTTRRCTALNNLQASVQSISSTSEQFAASTNAKEALVHSNALVGALTSLQHELAPRRGEPSFSSFYSFVNSYLGTAQGASGLLQPLVSSPPNSATTAEFEQVLKPNALQFASFQKLLLQDVPEAQKSAGC